MIDHINQEISVKSGSQCLIVSCDGTYKDGEPIKHALENGAVLYEDVLVCDKCGESL